VPRRTSSIGGSLKSVYQSIDLPSPQLTTAAYVAALLGRLIMPSELRSRRLAVLIDADNASAKIPDGLFEEIAKIGEASVRRIYGDFSNERSKG
jgi:hypothetical protein